MIDTGLMQILNQDVMVDMYALEMTVVNPLSYFQRYGKVNKTHLKALYWSQSFLTYRRNL